jgi:hypothetical protein
MAIVLFVDHYLFFLMAMRKRTNNDLQTIQLPWEKRTNNDLQTIQWP